MEFGIPKVYCKTQLACNDKSPEEMLFLLFLYLFHHCYSRFVVCRKIPFENYKLFF